MQPHEEALAALAGRGRLRALAPRAGLDFTSNDYLGFAEGGALRAAAAAALARGVPVGAGGSRLLRGNHPEHEALEAEVAGFFGSEAALYFSTGYGANAALVATLPRRGDLLVHDARIHASVKAGIDPARIQVAAAPHNDVTAMEDAVRRWRAAGGRGQVWLAVETLYSMDGDRAPLADLAALAEREAAMLLLDEAHATGVYGAGGRGLGAGLEGRGNVISLHTCGKALGAAGALVCLPRVARDFLVNRAASFIYSTAPSPLMAAVTRAALELCAGADAQRARLTALVARASASMKQMGLPASGSPILPVIVGQDARATALAGALQRRGYDVRAIRPPTVPEGTARLRLAITLNIGAAEIDGLFAALAAEMGTRMTARFIVSGTDTGIGKTVFAAGLCGFLGTPYWKPVQAGLDGETDSQTVQRLCGAPVLPEAYRLELAASPHEAAAAEGLAIDPARLRPPDGPLVIEGAGGLMVPLTRKRLFIDLFADWDMPLILCARTGLGTINHTLLSLEALRARGLAVLGVAFIGEAHEESESVIAEIGGARRLGRLPPLAPLTGESLAAAFAAQFRREDFL